MEQQDQLVVLHIEDLVELAQVQVVVHTMVAVDHHLADHTTIVLAAAEAHQVGLHIVVALADLLIVVAQVVGLLTVAARVAQAGPHIVVVRAHQVVEVVLLEAEDKLFRI